MSGLVLVDQLFVDPPAQGRGICTALLDRAKASRPTGLRLFTLERLEAWIRRPSRRLR